MEIKKYQSEIREWAVACFGEEIADDKAERTDRFMEEALELVQSLNMTKERVLILVDYVFNRKIEEEPTKEVGGVMTTLSTLCSANQIDLEESAVKEKEKVWAKIEKIREKQKTKPKHSPLPQ